MDEGYWSLFWTTGSPVFYLMSRKEPQEDSGDGGRA